MGIGYMEIPITDIPALPTQAFVNVTLGSLTSSASMQVTGTVTGINFPRTAAVAIDGDASNNQTYPPTPYSNQITGKVISVSGFFAESSYSTILAWLGRFDIVLIGADYEGWDQNSTYDRGLLVDAIRQVTHVTGFNPTEVWQYGMYEERFTNNGNQPYNTLFLTIDAQKWGLYGQPNQGGSPVSDQFGGGYSTNWAVAWPGTVNGVAADQQISPGRTTAHLDGSAEDLTQYAAAYFVEVLIARHSSLTTVVDGTIAASAYTDPRFYPNLSSGALHDAMKAPNLGAIFSDNLYTYPQTTGYYDLANSYGAYVTNSPTTPWLVRGAQHFKSRTQQLFAQCYPSRTYINVGNIGQWLSEYWNNQSTFTTQSKCGGISGYLHGGLFEATIGPTWSFEHTYGTVPTILSYQAVIDFCSAPKKCIIHSYPTNSTDYQTARYGLGICLMADGYYAASIAGNYNGANAMWMDEFGGNPGTNVGKGWLGQRVGSRPSAAGINGCWIADFQHGTCVLNPKGNGIQTITNTQINNFLGTSYTFSFIEGIQVPSINTGATMASVTLQAGDAIILRH